MLFYELLDCIPNEDKLRCACAVLDKWIMGDMVACLSIDVTNQRPTDERYASNDAF